MANALLASFNRGRIAASEDSKIKGTYWYEDHTTEEPYVLFVIENLNRTNHKQTMELLRKDIQRAGIRSYVITAAANVIESFDNMHKGGLVNWYGAQGTNSDWLGQIYRGVFKDKVCKCIVPFGMALTQIVKGIDIDMDDFLVPYFRPYFYLGNKKGGAIGDYDNHIFPVYNLMTIYLAEDENNLEMSEIFADTWVHKHFMRVLKQVAKDKSTWWMPDMDPYYLHTIKTHEECVQLLTEHMNSDVLSFDLETSGFDCFKDIIKCYTVAFDKDNGYYIPWTIMKDHVDLLSKCMKSTKKLIAVNGKFDLKFLWQNGLDKDIHLDIDLMLFAHIINCYGHKGLKSLTYLHTYFGGYEEALVAYKAKTGVKDYSKIPEPILSPYATIDVIAPLRILPELEALCDAFDSAYPSEKPIDKLGGVQWTVRKWFYEVCMPLENVVSSMEYRGVIISEPYRQKHKKILQGELDKTKVKLGEIMKVPASFKWFSTKELGALIKAKGYPQVNFDNDPEDPFGTDADSIFRWKQMAKAGDKRCNLEFLETLEYLRGIKNCLNSFIGTTEVSYDKKTAKRKVKKTGWEKGLTFHPEDGTWRVHPTYGIMGTDTFRMECSEPNFQNIPSHSIGNEYVKMSLGTPTADMFHVTSESGKVYHVVELDYIRTKEKGLIRVRDLTEDDTIDESNPEDVVKTYDELHPVPGITPTTYKQICEEYGYEF